MEQVRERHVGGRDGQESGVGDGGVQVFTAVFDQAVGVEQQRGAWGQDTLLVGAAAAGQAGPQQPLVPVEPFGPAVRMAEQRGWVSGVGPG